MTSLLEGARKLVTRGTEIGARIEGLQSAADAARGRLDDEIVDEADHTARKAAERLRLSADHTVVAIAGATGSGKSSTYNALTGLELSPVGVRRPTTSWASACVWGSGGAEELLSWLGIPPRHQTSHDSLLDLGDPFRRKDDFEGLVLLDLPDHDSTEVSHHLEVDRLVELADLLMWVLDPQKYADAALHDKYLSPLSSHGDVMVVVLNHIDTVPEDRRQPMIDDIRKLLDADGLQQVPIFAISAKHGDGMDGLRREIVKRVTGKQLTRARLEADLASSALRLQEAGGGGAVRRSELSHDQVSELESVFSDAAGVPTVVDAVERSTKARASRATGWPLVSWLSKLRPDPLKRLHLDLGPEGKQLTGTPRTSVPEPTPVQRARIDTEVRHLADEASQGLGRPWADAVRHASTARLDDLSDRLDSALGSADLGAAKLPIWVKAVRLLQWLLIAAALTGLVWLGALAVVGYLRLPEVPTPDVAGFPLPTLLLLGGVALGVLLALVCKVLVSATARSRAAAADRRLRARVHDVADELVVRPMQAELEAHQTVRAGLARVLE